MPVHRFWKASNIRITRTWLLGLLALVPIVYVGFLYKLSGIGFSHRCESWPMCGRDGLGPSIANLIETPQATGTFAAVFFWPLTRLWSLKHLLDNHRFGLLSLLGMYFAAGVFLMAPMDLFPFINDLSTFVFSMSSTIHYSFILLSFRGQNLRLCKVILTIGVMVFGLSVVLAVTARLLGAEAMERMVPFWLRYALEVTGMSCIALIPVLVRNCPNASTLSRVDSADIAGSAFGLLGRIALGGAMMLPVVYLWSLPLLAYVYLDDCPGNWPYGCTFAHQCRGFPYCTTSNTGFSVSSLLCTPQATGAMAVVFLIPFAHTWSLMERHHWDKPGDFTSLLLFYVFFTVFLSAPVNEDTVVHFVAVTCFCLSGLVHMLFLMKRLPPDTLTRPYMYALLVAGIIAFMSVIVIKVIAHVLDGAGLPAFFSDTAPWVFWACECTGLSSVVLLPWLWDRVPGEDNPWTELRKQLTLVRG